MADAVFGPLVLSHGYGSHASFVDNSVSLAWVTRGMAPSDCVDTNELLEAV